MDQITSQFLEKLNGMDVATWRRVQNSNRLELEKMKSSARILKSFVGAAVLLFASFINASAQQELTPPKAEVKGTAGGALFGEGEIPHGIIGGSFRYYLSRRWSVEPEFLYLYHSENDEDFIVQPNIAVDLLPPNKKVVPYLIAGVGAIHNRRTFNGFDFTTGAPRRFDVSSTGWTVSGGGGVRIFMTDRIFISPEARLGWEPTVRGTVSVGYVFSGKR
jgi:hypothetical protein